MGVEEKESEEEKGETDSVGGEKKEGEDAAAQEAEDEDDPSNLQLAWEMLELAKMVFKDQLGVALGFHMKYEEAVVSLEAAISVLETRIKNLENETESPDESKKADAFYTREKEVNEIET